MLKAKKNERKPKCFFVKNDKYRLMPIKNSIYLNFFGHIEILKVDVGFKQ